MIEKPSLPTMPAAFDVLAFLADLLEVDLDADPFALSEQEQQDTPTLQTFPVLNCCCPHPDAQTCAALRSRAYVEDIEPDDACQCACHLEDEDEEDSHEDAV